MPSSVPSYFFIYTSIFNPLFYLFITSIIRTNTLKNQKVIEPTHVFNNINSLGGKTKFHKLSRLTLYYFYFTIVDICKFQLCYVLPSEPTEATKYKSFAYC